MCWSSDFCSASTAKVHLCPFASQGANHHLAKFRCKYFFAFALWAVYPMLAECNNNFFSFNQRLVNPEEWFLKKDWILKSSNDEKTKKVSQVHFDKVKKSLIDLLPDVSDIRPQKVKKKKTGYKTKSEEKVQKRKIGHKICMTLIGLRYFVVFNYFLICRV